MSHKVIRNFRRTSERPGMRLPTYPYAAIAILLILLSARGDSAVCQRFPAPGTLSAVSAAGTIAAEPSSSAPGRPSIPSWIEVKPLLAGTTAEGGIPATAVTTLEMPLGATAEVTFRVTATLGDLEGLSYMFRTTPGLELIGSRAGAAPSASAENDGPLSIARGKAVEIEAEIRAAGPMDRGSVTIVIWGKAPAEAIQREISSLYGPAASGLLSGELERLAAKGFTIEKTIRVTSGSEGRK